VLRALVGRMVLSRVVLLVYIVVGFLVANSHHYFAHLNGAKPIISAVLAVFLWPLVLLGINLRIK
jgi:hypothetical protein